MDIFRISLRDVLMDLSERYSEELSDRFSEGFCLRVCSEGYYEGSF